jgi:hypothetical protein
MKWSGNRYRKQSGGDARVCSLHSTVNVPGLGRPPIPVSSDLCVSLSLHQCISARIHPLPHIVRWPRCIHRQGPFVAAAATGADIPINAVSCSRRCTFCCGSWSLASVSSLRSAFALLWLDSISVTVKFLFKNVRYLLVYSNALSRGTEGILIWNRSHPSWGREQVRANARNQ